MWFITNNDVESVAENEVWDPAKGGYKEDGGDRLGNWLVGMLSGGSDRKGEIDALVKAKYVKNLQEDYGNRIDKYGNVAGMETISDSMLSTLTPEQLDRKLLNNQATKDARSSVVESYGLNPDEFVGMTDAASIKGKGLRLYNQAQKQEAKDNITEQRIYNEGLNEREQIRNDRIRAENRADNAQARTENLEFRRDNMNLNHTRLARQDAIAAKDLRDKNIMMLLTGFQNVAQNFTV